jgi:hypothetical protein
LFLHSLAARLVGVVANRDLLGGLVQAVGLLADDLDTLLVGDNTNGLVVDETGLLAGVQVGQVEGVLGELETTAVVALNQEGILVACNIATISTTVPFSSLEFR